MNIGQAIDAMRQGAAVTRPSWNGKGMWLKLQVADANSKMTEPYIYIEYPPNPSHPVYPSGCRAPWLASQADLLAVDWLVTKSI